MKTKLKGIISALLCMCFCVSMLVVPNYSASADDSAIDLGTVFSEWVNYPNQSYGAGYKAGWSYTASTGALNTTANVGFTGYYNPYLMNFTTGTWGIDFQSSDGDPWGFAWGLKTWKNDAGTDSYSFYVYEECGHNNWCIAYIEEWQPAKDGGSHRGPVYHSTIDAADSQYAAHNGGKGSVGFATGKVLAYGTATVKGVRHRITIDATKTKVTLTNSVSDFKLVGNNGSNAVQNGNNIIVDAPIQAGSFGPCSASNAGAYFYNLSMEAGEDNGAIRADFQPYSDGIPTYAGKAGEDITIENTSWLDPETKATIKSEEWVITYMDGEDGPEEIYSGSTPFVGTFDREGEYRIYLRIISSQGLSARKTKYFTVTDENTLTVKYMDEEGNKLCDDFIYRGKAGTPYQTSALSFDGYKLYSVDGEESGYFSDKPFGVTYIYKPLTADDVVDDNEEPMEVGQVTVKYVDENGTELLPDLIYKAEIGDSFKANSLTIPGYAFKGLADGSAEESGRYGLQEKTIIYEYTADTSTTSDAGTLLVRYVDVDGNTVSTDVIVNGDVGTIYSVNRRSILGYRINHIDGDETVTLYNGVQVVYVVYEPATYTASSVVAKYIDVDGNTIRPDDVYNGDDGETFSITPAYIKGYKFVEILSDKADDTESTEDTEETESTEETDTTIGGEISGGDALIEDTPSGDNDDASKEEPTVPGLVEGVFKPQMLQIITYIYKQFTNIDIDNDGIPDINIDTDDDGTPDVNIDITDDGIPDINVDTDGDGEPDVNIVDEDGDGKPDINIDPENPPKPNINIVDKDGDGEPDVNIDNTDPENPVLPDVNVDITDDGIPDINVDTDDDGIPDVNIVDEDHDGKPDTDIDPEDPPKPNVNIVDKDGDGKPDVNIDNTDPENPVLPDVNVDVTGNGIPDVNVDTDDDGIPDVNIVDKDKDGVPDKDIDNTDSETPVIPDLNIVDKDGDGKPDVDIIPTPEDPVKPNVNIDKDGDGEPDINIDTDNDGKPDINIDTDDDGKPDVNIDTDNDGKPDVNIDTNDDGKPDINIDTDDDGKPDVNIDTDDDGEPDINIDLDGDGEPDIDIDTDGDGIPDINIDEDDDKRIDTYVYVNYIAKNGEGKDFPEKVIIRGNMGDDYSVENLMKNDIYGYQLIATPDNVSGTMDKVVTTVDFVYELKKTSVIVNYVDEDNNELSEQIVIEGLVFDTFDTERLDIFGYNLVDIKDSRISFFSRIMRAVADVFSSENDLEDISGIMEEDVIEIDYVYSLKNASVIVKYVDENGNEISESEMTDYKYFQNYTSEAKDIYAYNFVSVNGTPSAEVDRDEITVIYVYKQVLNIDTDNDGKPDINIDTDGDGEPDVNIDIDDDGKPDVNIDTDDDGKPDVNIDTDDDGKPDVNIDIDDDGKPDVNIDIDDDGKPDVNIDIDDDGKPDVNIDTDDDGKPDVNIDTDDDGKPDVNIDTDDDGKPDVNIDTDGDGKPNVNIDTDDDGKPDVNIDTDDDGKPDVNIDVTGNGKPDINIDTTGDGNPDTNVDINGDGIADINIDTTGNGVADSNIDTDGDGIADKNIIGDNQPTNPEETTIPEETTVSEETTIPEDSAVSEEQTPADTEQPTTPSDEDGVNTGNGEDPVDTGSTDMFAMYAYAAIAMVSAFFAVLFMKKNRKEDEAEA